MYTKQLNFEWTNEANVEDLETASPFSPNYTMKMSSFA